MKKVSILITFVLLLILLVSCSYSPGPVHDEGKNGLLNSGTTVGVPNGLTSNNTTVSTTNTTNVPPARISIRDKDRYELLKAASKNDAALDELLKKDDGILLRNREDVLEFLKVLDSVPAFSVENAKHFSISYWPSKQSLHVVYQLSEEKEMHWYRFEFNLNKAENLEIKEKIKQEAGTKEYAKVGKDRNIEVWKRVVDLSQTEFAGNYAIYRVEVDGMMISVQYKNAYMDVREQKAEDVFSMVRVEETFDKAVAESFRISAEKQ